MNLIAELERAKEHEESPFRVQLLREDIARLSKLQSLATSCQSLEDFKKEGLFIGWTGSDMHTHLIQHAIDPLLDKIYAYETGGQSEDLETALRRAWKELNEVRMEKLIRCL